MIADNVVNYLVANTDLVKGKNLFSANMPDTPSECVVVFDTGGSTPYQEVPVDFPTVQIICRGSQNQYAITRTRANEIFDLLNRKKHYTLDSVDVMQSRAIQTPSSLGLNDRNRWEIVCNYLFEIRKT